MCAVMVPQQPIPLNHAQKEQILIHQILNSVPPILRITVFLRLIEQPFRLLVISQWPLVGQLSAVESLCRCEDELEAVSVHSEAADEADNVHVGVDVDHAVAHYF